ELMKFCKRRRIPTSVPWASLDAAGREAIFTGDGRGDFPGIRPWFKWLEGRTYKKHVRVFLSRSPSYRVCPDFTGPRPRAEALALRIAGCTVADLARIPIGEVAAFFAGLALPAGEAAAVAALVLDEIRSRLRYLTEVGLEYLTLDRQSRTLSGGEL